MNRNHRALAGQALALAAASALLSSCGGRAGPQSPAQALSAANLAAGFLTSVRFNNNPSTAISSAAQGFSGKPSPILLSAKLAGGVGAAAASCGYSSSPSYSSRVDADSDGIPTTLSWAFDYDSQSCGDPASSTRWKFKGSFVEKDLDDSQKWLVGGWTTEWEFTSSATYSSGRYQYVGDGIYTAKRSGNKINHVGDYQGTVTWTAGSLGGSFDYDGEFSYVVTPDSLSDSLAHKTGAVQINGTWTYSGVFPEEDDSGDMTDESIDVTFRATSVNLRYDDTCSKYWKTGEFRYDMGNHLFRAVYDCTTVKYYFDGEEYDPSAHSH